MEKTENPMRNSKFWHLEEEKKKKHWQYLWRFRLTIPQTDEKYQSSDSGIPINT